MEPSSYKVEMEKKKQTEQKYWMEVTPAKVTARLPKDNQLTSAPKIRPQLQRSTSEILVSSSTYGGYVVQRTGSKYIIKDNVSPDSSVGTLISRSLFQLDVEGVEKSDRPVIPLTRSRHFTNTRSSIDIFISGVDYTPPPVSSSSSCHEFLVHPDGSPNRSLNYEGLQLYNQAQSIFNNFMRALNLRNEFEQMEQHFITLYPNYWKHLLKKCNVYMNAELAAEEREAMLDVVGICNRTLQDEIDIEGRSYMRDIGLRGNDIPADFQISIMYLKTKYPCLFAYLAKKHNFKQFAKERTMIHGNWNEVEKLLKLDPTKLEEREKKYSGKRIPKEH